ncbi:MAG: alpha/beta fold hydrolase [Beutenbergiaceae bacterium]
MPTITTHEPAPTRLYVTDTGGDGTPVVLIHGWPLSGAAFASNRGALRAAGYRVITYDRRGFGQSGRGGSYDYDTFAADLHTVMTELNLQGAVIVGFSMGGGEVARYCARYGTGALVGVVLSGSICPALCITPDNPDGAMPPSGFEEIAQSCRTDFPAFATQFVTWYFSNEQGLCVSEQEHAAAVSIALQADPQAAAQAALAWATDLREDCRSIDVPALILHGTEDRNVPLAASSARVGEFIPDSRLVTIDGGPHGLNVSHRQQWEGALIDFLDGLARSE